MLSWILTQSIMFTDEYRHWHSSHPIQVIKINNLLWKWKLNITLEKWKARFIKGNLFMIWQPWKIQGNYLSLTLKWKGSSFFRHHSNKGILGYLEKKICLFYMVNSLSKFIFFAFAEIKLHISALVKESNTTFLKNIFIFGKRESSTESNTTFFKNIFIFGKRESSTEQLQRSSKY